MASIASQVVMLLEVWSRKVSGSMIVLLQQVVPHEQYSYGLST